MKRFYRRRRWELVKKSSKERRREFGKRQKTAFTNFVRYIFNQVHQLLLFICTSKIQLLPPVLSNYKILDFSTFLLESKLAENIRD